MIIDHDRRFVFLHVPKTAGTSVRERLLNGGTNLVNLWHQGWVASEGRVVDLAHLPAYLAHEVLTREKALDYFKFAFVRDPKSRFVSGLKEVARRHSEEFGLSTKAGFLTFLRSLRPASIAFDWTLVHLCPQHVFLYLGDACIADEVSADLASLSPKLQGLLGNDQLPTLRKAEPSSIDTWVEELDSEVTATVNRLYWKDYELMFGRACQPPVAHDSDRVQVSLDPIARRLVKPDHTWSENMLRCWDQSVSRPSL